MSERLRVPATITTGALPYLAAALTVAVFVVDVIPWIHVAIAVLYVIVVLLSVSFLSRRLVAVVGGGCMILTVVALLISDGPPYPAGSIVRCLVSLSAIAITTLLAIRNQTATLTLGNQAQLLELTHDAIFVRDMSDVITYWNGGAEDLYRLPRQVAIGKVAHELLQTDYPEPLVTIKSSLLATGRWEGEVVYARHDGSRLVIASRWSLQRDDHGRPVAIMETNTDVTARREAEAKARQYAEELETTLNAIPALVWRANGEGRIDAINQRWADVGRTFEDLAGDGWRNHVHPDDLSATDEHWAEAATSGAPYENLMRMRIGSGAYHWFLMRAVALRDEAGTISRWFGIAADIEDQKRAEDALRRSEAYLSEAQRLSLTGSFGWNAAAETLVWSAETYRILGYAHDVQPTADAVLNRVFPDDVAMVQHVFDAFANGEASIDISHRLLIPDGTIKYVHAVARLHERGPDGAEYIGAVCDVTASRHVQEALLQAQADLAHVTRVATLGELTATIAHEVNQPLAGIVTNGDACLRWMDREPPNMGEVRNSVVRMIDDGRRASDVIRRLRSLLRKDVLRSEPLAINEVVHDSLRLVGRELERHRVATRLDLASDLPPIVGDPVQLQQVLINLVINGIQSIASAGSQRREILVRSRLLPGGQIEIAIRDSGGGIPPEHAKQLFDPFFTTKRDGIGMGLAICRSIIETHGGQIGVVQTGLPGACLQFTLPVPSGDQE